MVPSKGDQRFPRSLHLRRPGEFKKNRQLGRSRRSSHLVVSLSPGPGPGPRLGLTVSRKVGGAVKRNRLKRRLREVFRLELERFPADTDVVIVALPGSDRLSLEQIRHQVLGCLERLVRDQEAEDEG